MNKLIKKQLKKAIENDDEELIQAIIDLHIAHKQLDEILKAAKELDAKFKAQKGRTEITNER